MATASYPIMMFSLQQHVSHALHQQGKRGALGEEEAASYSAETAVTKL